MENRKLPTKLGKEPLVDVVFEVRMKSKVPLSTLLPGVLLGTLLKGSSPTVVRLPAAHIPDEIRVKDEQLRYTPLLAIEWGSFRLLIGDESIIVACSLPYPGWAKFKSAILDAVRTVLGTGLVERIERYSVKYVDLISLPSLVEQIKALNWDVRLGGHKLSAEVATLRVEVARDGFTQLIGVQTGAVVAFKQGGTSSGVLIDVDTICKVDSGDVAAFDQSLSDGLESMHASNKEIFFECLSNEMIRHLEPTYA
jgi:uncharacterized protein (TIGR04255 family)